MGFDPAAVLGLFSGASTNTPSLGAGSQALGTLPASIPRGCRCPRWPTRDLPDGDHRHHRHARVLRLVFRVDVAREAAELAARQRVRTEPLERRTLVVTNANLDGLRLEALPACASPASRSRACSTASRPAPPRTRRSCVSTTASPSWDRPPASITSSAPSAVASTTT
jgi:hypothetical protein